MPGVLAMMSKSRHFGDVKLEYRRECKMQEGAHERRVSGADLQH